MYQIYIKNILLGFKLSIIFIICLFSCGDMTDNEKLHHSWIIDENFSLEEQQMIKDGIEQWIIATDGMFYPIDITVGPVYPWQPFAVELVNSNDPRVLKIEEEKINQGYKNYELGGLYTYNDSIFVVNERWNIGTVIHEFGHFFGLKHLYGSVPDVMNWLIGKKLDCISKQNIKTFCSLHDCFDYDVKPTCELPLAKARGF